MANERQSPERNEFTAENEIDVVLGNANPNPERIGCPSQDVLVALARRERPATDPAYDHLIKCSPCYRRVRALQQAAGERRELPVWRSWRAPAMAAAVILLAVAGGWFLWPRPGPSAPEEATSPAVQAPTSFSAHWDYRSHSVLRSDANQAEQPPLVLPRSPERVTISLPPGFLPGKHDIQLLDANLRSVASATGTAEMREHVATIETVIDVSKLPAGAYQVAVRREGESWRLFPARLE